MNGCAIYIIIDDRRCEVRGKRIYNMTGCMMKKIIEEAIWNEQFTSKYCSPGSTKCISHK